MNKRRCHKITPYVKRAARDLANKKTSKKRRSQASRTLINHKKRHH